MTSRLHNMSREQLISFIDERKGGIIASFEDICEAIYELKTRYKFDHSPIRNQLFRFYAEVRNGRLTGAMVYALGGDRRYLIHMEGRPKELQNELAGGKLVSIATRTAKGEIVEKDKAIVDMTFQEIARAFPIGKSPATVYEQRAALELELPKEFTTPACQVPTPRADAKTQTFTLGSATVPLTQVVEALREIGLEVRGLAKLMKDAT